MAFEQSRPAQQPMTLPAYLPAFRPPPGLCLAPPPGLAAAPLRASPDLPAATKLAVAPPPGLFASPVCPEEEGSHAAAGSAPMKPLGLKATTLVIQNIPGRYTQEDILAIWPIDGTYDYLHVPYNLLQKRPLGYVFLNFLSNEHARAFQQKWHGRTLPGNSGARKPLDVCAAEVQGRQANLELIKSRKIGQLGKAGFLPLVLDPRGVRLDAKAILAAGSAAKSGRQQAEQQRLFSKATSEKEDSDAETHTTAPSVCAVDSLADDASSQDGDFSPMYVPLRL